MKNLTADQKKEIIKTVSDALDLPDVDIYFQMSKEMKAESDASDAEVAPTGAMAFCVSVKSSPAVLWAADVEGLKKRIETFK